MKLRTHSQEETQALAKRLLEEYPHHRVWLLEGELAAGKTQLVKGLAESLGVEVPIVSPTFTYLNEYGDQLAHYDLYRLEGPDDELLQLLSEHLQSPIHVAIEWPSRMNLHLAQPHLHLALHHQGGDERSVEVTPHS